MLSICNACGVCWSTVRLCLTNMLHYTLSSQPATVTVVSMVQLFTAEKPSRFLCFSAPPSLFFSLSPSHHPSQLALIFLCTPYSEAKPDSQADVLLLSGSKKPHYSSFTARCLFLSDVRSAVNLAKQCCSAVNHLACLGIEKDIHNALLHLKHHHSYRKMLQSWESIYCFCRNSPGHISAVNICKQGPIIYSFLKAFYILKLFRRSWDIKSENVNGILPS